LTYLSKIDKNKLMKILIIEDDRSIRDVLKMSFESEAFVVDVAADGDSGSFMARVNKYDVILLDFVMPNKNGLEVCKDIRDNEIQTPIIMLTGKGDVLTKIELLNNGADDYITKPFSFEELMARVRAVTRRPKKIESDIFKSGKIKINPNNQEVTISNKKVYMTRKEFLLLEILMKNQDNVVSRANIMEYVWDNNANPFSNTIEAHIRNLRKKIKDKDRKIIESVAGRGYKMNCVKKANLVT
jgi:DNA-binding response OmpR family regulator